MEMRGLESLYIFLLYGLYRKYVSKRHTANTNFLNLFLMRNLCIFISMVPRDIRRLNFIPEFPNIKPSVLLALY